MKQSKEQRRPVNKERTLRALPLDAIQSVSWQLVASETLNCAPRITLCIRCQGHITLPTYWWSFPVYSSSRKNWFHIHPRLERCRTLPPSLSGIPNSFPIFPGARGMAVLGHSMESAKRSSSWLAIIVSNQLQNVPNDLWIMVMGFWLDEHWKAVSSEQTLYSSACDVVQIPAGGEIKDKCLVQQNVGHFYVV